MYYLLVLSYRTVHYNVLTTQLPETVSQCALLVMYSFELVAGVERAGLLDAASGPAAALGGRFISAMPAVEPAARAAGYAICRRTGTCTSSFGQRALL